MREDTKSCAYTSHAIADACKKYGVITLKIIKTYHTGVYEVLVASVSRYAFKKQINN